ncbi:FAD-dependent monooxygenase [Amycolatopsis sp. 195334CR]|uniref:FAD-dependent monooxygenase n=1 Tax=Amycolatopsis sp. 195334CR TaxID=2814588 RepID=UPI001A90388F|nr:FAD-dependent monooxygenase [Amycolatopsis sp. 195334CR]MBN6040607.1 FAD-dependent monooxygenase [Amycolatopsis sp. 195334CR]
MKHDVIVVGAGPVGLMLAGELRLGGAEVVVLEARAVPSGQSRGLGFTARATEVFAQRGLLGRFGAVETTTQGHFGGIPLDFGVVDGAHFGVRGIPQHRVEAVLEQWAGELGATILRGHSLVELSDTGDGVVAVADGPDGPAEFSAGYLVGCDGGQSTVRGLAGFDFPGTAATREMYLADVAGCDIRPRFIGERVAGGMVMAAPLGGGVDRIIVCPLGLSPGAGEPAFGEIADRWLELTGQRLHDAEVRWHSRFTDATRQVSTYRKGRVLLAGDAAHIHLPAGGQGLSLGVQDAVNLGWKLAATVRGTAPPGLLDSYHAERHPVGSRVLRNTLAQGLLYLSGEEVDPLRAIMAELMAVPDAARLLVGMVSGLDIRYDLGPGPAPLGMRMPDVPLDARRTVSELLHDGRGVLLDGTGSAGLAAAAGGWADRVDHVVARPLAHTPAGWPAGVAALLLRPDGYVAWTGTTELETELGRWFGAARPMEAGVAR